MNPRVARCLKPLLLVVLVFGLVSAASAQAEPSFEADAYPATIDGTPLSATIFTFGGEYKWTCHSTSYTGSLAAKSTQLTITPSYSTCSWSYPVTEPQQPYSIVKVSMNGCDYRLHSGKRLELDKYQDLLSLECPAGQQVVIELNQGPTTICRLTVRAQSNKSHVGLTDKTIAPNDVELAATVKGLKYTQDLSGFIPCPVKAGAYENLEFTALATLTATSGGKQVGLRVTGE
jgi:hypothetical protein